MEGNSISLATNYATTKKKNGQNKVLIDKVYKKSSATQGVTDFSYYFKKLKGKEK